MLTTATTITGCEMREELRETELEALRRDIAEGLASGPAQPLDMEAIKTDACRGGRAAKHGA
jgi:antitoxin ParD1/3/4